MDNNANTGNMCYMNALVRMISWMFEATRLQVSSFGVACNAWRGILAQRKAFSVQQLFPWSVLLQGWAHNGQQHDICEFFSHLMHQCHVSPFHGIWDARLWEAKVTTVRDQGVCENMISRDVINDWGNQANTHALRFC